MTRDEGKGEKGRGRGGRHQNWLLTRQLTTLWGKAENESKCVFIFPRKRRNNIQNLSNKTHKRRNNRRIRITSVPFATMPRYGEEREEQSDTSTLPCCHMLQSNTNTEKGELEMCLKRECPDPRHNERFTSHSTHDRNRSLLSKLILDRVPLLRLNANKGISWAELRLRRVL